MSLVSFFNNHPFLKKHIANFITFIGMILATAVAVLVFWGGSNPATYFYIFALGVLVALSDLDGQVARRWGVVSKSGATLDKLRDKMFACPLFYFFLSKLWQEVGLLAVSIKFFLVVILFVEISLITLSVIGIILGKDGKSNKWGKTKMVSYFIILNLWLCICFFESWLNISFGITAQLVLLPFLAVASALAVGSFWGYLTKWGWNGNSVNGKT